MPYTLYFTPFTLYPMPYTLCPTPHTYNHSSNITHMAPIEILGYIAGTMSSLVFLPQVIKTWKTKSANDISLVMFLFATASVVLWLVYRHHHQERFHHLYQQYGIVFIAGDAVL